MNAERAAVIRQRGLLSVTPSLYQYMAAAGHVGSSVVASPPRPNPSRKGIVMRVLLAGDRGYIGAVLAPFLRSAGHEVAGLDLDLYAGCDLGTAPEDIGLQPPSDIRDVQAA